MTSNFLENLTNRKSEGGDDAEPKDGEYRAVWRMAHPAACEIRMGSLWFSMAYGHLLGVFTASSYFTGLWIITPDITFTFDGDNLREVATSLNDRKARALTLFEPEFHKKWDEKSAIIRAAQPIVVPSQVAFRKAAEVFGFSAAPLPEKPGEDAVAGGAPDGPAST